MIFTRIFSISSKNKKKICFVNVNIKFIKHTIQNNKFFFNKFVEIVFGCTCVFLNLFAGYDRIKFKKVNKNKTIFTTFIEFMRNIWFFFSKITNSFAKFQYTMKIILRAHMPKTSFFIWTILRFLTPNSIIKWILFTLLTIPKKIGIKNCITFYI